MPKRILIIAGEASGDLYGAHLINALKVKYPDALFSGIGGREMEASGVKILFPINELAIIGISEIFFKIKTLKRIFNALSEKIKNKGFDLAILVNYPGFNLKLAKVLKSHNIPVVFYSSPHVWIWGKWRLKIIKKYIDKMIVFMKFEEDFYKKHNIDAKFVGHPLVDIAKPQGKNLNIEKNEGAKIISLMPGSRKSEIINMFPAIFDAARIIHEKDKNTKFIITKHPELPLELYEKSLKKYNLPAKLIEGNIHDCLNISDLAITVSGSVTLEAAILKIPMVIIYKISFLNMLIFSILARIIHIGLVNIVAGKRIMPELVQYSARPQRIAKEALDILSSRERYKKMKEDLEKVGDLLGSPGASKRACDTISKLL